MIKVFGQAPSRAQRVLWLLEEMELPYECRAVHFESRLDNEEFMSANPAGTLPAFIDGDVTIGDSTAATVYLAARYGPTGLAIEPSDPRYPLYLQFLHFAEASLGGLLGASIASRYFAPEEHRGNWAGAFALDLATRRSALVARQLEKTPFVTGDSFTLADISVAYCLSMWGLVDATDLLEPILQDYLARMQERPAWQRAAAA